MQGILVLDIVTAVLAITPLLFIDIPQPEGAPDRAASKTSGRRRVMGDVIAGLRYVSSWRGLFLLIILAALWRTLIIPLYDLIPLLVRNHFSGGAPELAWVSSARGFSVVVGGGVLTLWGGFKRRTLTILLGLLSISLLTGALGLVPAGAFWTAVAIMAVRTIWLPLAVGSYQALLQSVVPAALQGRVVALTRSLMTVSVPLGLAIAGPLADLLKVRWLFPLWGAGAALLALAGMLIPSILYLEDRPGPNEDLR
jgi:DHA3 family macrolide efflux protein-like MFS transporter